VQMDKELQEGSVYYISNGKLSGADRRYSTTGNDYRINFNEKTEVKAAPDQVGCAQAILQILLTCFLTRPVRASLWRIGQNSSSEAWVLALEPCREPQSSCRMQVRCMQSAIL
jgi:hypothetical protein